MKLESSKSKHLGNKNTIILKLKESFEEIPLLGIGIQSVTKSEK